MAQLTFAGGLSSPALGDPGIWYSAVTRAAGRTLLGTLTIADVTKSVEFGFDTAATGALGASAFRVTADTLLTYNLGVAGPVVFVPADATAYQFAIVLRSTGTYYFVKGGVFTYWTLVWIGSSDNTATVYPGISNYDAAFTADNIRIPTKLWLPTSLCYDTFARADAAIGTSETTGPDGQTVTARAWTGATWTISTNAAINTPSTTGGELITNGNMEAGDPPTGWTPVNGTPSQVADERTGGGGTKSINLLATGAYPRLQQVTSAAVGTWFTCSTWHKWISGNTLLNISHRDAFATAYSGVSVSATSSWAMATFTSRMCVVTDNISMYRNSALLDSGEVRFDDVSVLALSLPTLFASVSTATVSVMADVNITRTVGTQAGLVVNLDSAASPANFILAYLDGMGNVKADKCAAGTYTNLITAAVTYGAGYTLRVVSYLVGSDLKVRVFYNNLAVGTEQTVSDAAIVASSLVGMFSTSSLNSFDQFCVWPRGNGNEFFEPR